MGDALVAIPGVKLASGKQAYGSPEMAAWLPVFIRFQRVVRGVVVVVIKTADLTATAASSTTHLLGYATDKRSWNMTAAERNQMIEDATRYGMPEHYRIKAQGLTPHVHGMLAVGYSTPCSCQITATRNGRDGLAKNGPDLDKAHRPPLSQWLGYSAGIAAMNARINAVLNPQEEDMPLTEADAALVARKVWSQMLTAGGQKSAIQAIAESNVKDEAQSVALGRLAAQVSALSGQLEVAVDEGAIVAGVVASITDKLTDSVLAAIAMHLADIEDAEAESIATAVVDELAKRVAA